MRYGTGPTTPVQVDLGLLVRAQMFVSIIIISSDCSAQTCSKRAGDYSSSAKE